MRFGFTGLGCLLLASAALAQSPFISNDIKYKDSGVKPATGRAGSATLEARALIGKDHVTTVEVASNGTLEKVQVKLTANDVTRNFNNLAAGNAFSTTFDDLTHGEPVQVQANVTGADPSRTGVVTVSTSVARRPDLAVVSVSAPPHGYVYGPMRVSAVVRELNGETGARANCVLSVDGADVDRADNIWVDAGGTVTCTFAPEFTSAGDKQLAVRVENARPADDDGANNSASSATKIYDQAEQFAYWTADARDTEFEYTWNQDSWWNTRHEMQKGWYANTQFRASVPGTRVDFPNLRVSMWESTDGELVQETLDAPLQFYSVPSEWWDEPARECAVGFDGDRMFEACETEPFGWFQGSFWIEVSRGAGDVTYRSSGWDRNYQTNTPPGYYTWNTAAHDVYGLQKHLGQNVDFRLRVSDGSALWEANGGVTLTPQVMEYSQPRTCYDTYMGPSCYDYYSRYDMKIGNAWGVAQ